MTFLDTWGWVCALAGTLAALPQVLRLLRVRTSAGLSLLLWQLNLGAGIGWVVHGIAGGYANVTVPNVVISLTNVLILLLIQRDRGLSVRAVWPLGLAVAAACIAIELTLPSGAFGLFVLVPHSVGLLAQTRDLLRSPDLTGVSPVFLVAVASIQYLWFVWGVLVGDLSVVICASVLAVLGTVNLALYAVRSRRSAPSTGSGIGAPSTGSGMGAGSGSGVVTTS